MEKVNDRRDMNRIFFITGAESTGKSTLTAALGAHFGAPVIPEYAREYLEKLGRPYLMEDVDRIAHHHNEQIRLHRQTNLVFVDTCLINLKVWFREVYGVVPDWLLQELPQNGDGVYLLCEPDLPWEYDPLRENPERREYLTEEYEKELIQAGFPYFRISGSGQQRLLNAIDVVYRVLKPDIIG